MRRVRGVKIVLMASTLFLLAACGRGDDEAELVADNQFDVGMNTGNTPPPAPPEPIITSEMRDPYAGLVISSETGQSEHRPGMLYVLKFGRTNDGEVRTGEFDYVDTEGNFLSEHPENGEAFKERSESYINYIIENQTIERFYAKMNIPSDAPSDGREFVEASKVLLTGVEQEVAYEQAQRAEFDAYVNGEYEEFITGDSPEAAFMQQQIRQNQVNPLQEGQQIVGEGQNGIGLIIQNDPSVTGFTEGTQ